MVLMILMISIILKSNVWAFVYLVIVIKYLLSPAKQNLLVRLTIYISGCFIAQYMLFMLNLTNQISPSPFPIQFKGYPDDNQKDMTNITFAIPVFFHHKIFRDLRFSYFLGVGVEQPQLRTLFLDFANLCIVTIYVFNFRNPLLFRSMRKVFWQFPTNMDSKESWDRLDDDVRKQLKWMENPMRITDSQFKEISEELKPDSKLHRWAEDEYDF